MDGEGGDWPGPGWSSWSAGKILFPDLGEGDVSDGCDQSSNCSLLICVLCCMCHIPQ